VPYILESARKEINNGRVPENAGELNYQLTCLIQAYLENVSPGKAPAYKDINDVVGALECCKIEFYRRLVAPYEDLKITENGDVY
jgi:hypothetical protein